MPFDEKDKGTVEPQGSNEGVSGRSIFSSAIQGHRKGLDEASNTADDLTRQTYLDVLNTISEAVYIQDENGTFIDVNEGAARMYKCRREDLIGKNPLDVGIAEKNDYAEVARLSAEVWHTGVPAAFEFWARHFDGGEILKEVIVNKGVYFGRPVLIATARDITERRKAEISRQEREEFYRKLLMNLPDLVIRTDLQGTVVYVNEYSHGSFPQFSKSDVIGRNMLSFIAAEDLEIAIENTRKMFEKPLGPKEYRVVDLEGKVIECEINGDILYDMQQNPTGMVYVLRDISERKKAERELFRSREMLQLILDNIPLYVFWKDLNSVFLGCNNNFAKVCGLSSPDEVIGKTDYDMVWKKEEADFFVSVDQRIIKSGIGEYHIIEPQTRTDGKTSWLDTNKGPLYDSDGKIMGVLGTFLDITDRRMAEEQILQQTRLRELLVEISSTYINIPIESVEAEIARSMNKLSQFVGADRCYIFEYDETTNICSNTHEWCGEGIEPQIDNLQSIELPEEWREAFSHGNPIYIPDVSFLPEGLTKDILEPQQVISLIVLPMIHNNRCIGFMGFDSVRSKHTYSDIEQQLLKVFTQMLVNIRLRKQSEEDLIKAKEKAEESDRLKMAFLANMSHEIRTPMNGILGFAGLLKEANLSGSQREEYIGLIEKSGARMLSVINDIISISKIEAGLMTVNDAEVNVNEQIEYVYSFFKPEAVAKGLALVLNTPLPADAAVVSTDGEKLYAVLSNLVKNAITYSARGVVEIGYRKEPDRLVFFVKDEGIGIPKEKQSMIFERFIQVDNSNTRSYEGAGLGLAIAKAYLDMLGGSISVESDGIKGSTFFFTIPCSNAKAKQAFSQRSEHQQANASHQNLNLLVAEDDEISFRLISKIMEQCCKMILRAKTGREAISVYAEHPEIDVILMDVKMPDMDGYEATRRIRKISKHVIVIAQTAYGLENDYELAIKAGCNDYMAKPIDPTALHAMINSLLEEKKATP